jgi:DNA adenine methylase
VIGPLAYIGGKRRIARQLAALIPEHTAYVEPFAGGAQLFFNKRPSRVEVLNDLDGEVINFLRICQQLPAELLRVMRFWVASRDWHAAVAAQDPERLTDVQRAARFLYLQKNSFGGRVRRQVFHYCVTKPSNFSPARLPDLVAAAAKRLSQVQLEHWPYEKVLARYDRPTTFFYLDPPYAGISLYKFNFTDDDYGTLASRLRGLSGKFLLSVNDCVLTRTVFTGFEVRSVSLVYTANRKVPTARELLVANYPLTSLSDAVLIGADN